MAKSRKNSKRRSKSIKKSSSYKVQSVIVPKSAMSESVAKAWIKKHYKLGKIDITANTYRFRQIAPDTVRTQGYRRFKIKKLPNGVELVLAYKV